MYIIKRSGKQVAFEKEAILNAVFKAADATEGGHKEIDSLKAEYVAAAVEQQCERLGHTPHVEEVQDIVIHKLQEVGAFNVAKNYAVYRYQRELVRKANSTDDQIASLIDDTNEEIKGENSNKNPILHSTTRDYIAGIVSKDITNRLLLPQDVVEAHNDGIIHFHDSDYFLQKMYNCFSGGTKLITDRGTVPFKELRDGQEVTVKDLNGVLRKATVRKYGKQKMQKVHLKAGRMSQIIRCTPDHRWVLEDGSVTTSLKEGDMLYALKDSTDAVINSAEEAEAFCLGFIVGDGCDGDNGAGRDLIKVRLCGDKVKYADYFKMAGYTISPLKGTEDLICRANRAAKQNFLNGKGWRFMSAEAQALAFKGYYAADGAKDSNRVSTADERICSFIEETSGLAGYYVSSMKEIIRDTEFKKGAKLYNYHFVTSNPVNMLWKVERIESLGNKTADAWCVEEPITHTFTLEKGIVTGNCCLVNLEDMLQNGTVISGTQITKPRSFLTACNIAAQIVAQVASNQYGGQTISAAHLAPFVDISRQKIREDVREEMREEGDTVDEAKVARIAERRLMKEVKSGVQTLNYQLLTLMTTNGQTPFVTVFLYIDEAAEGQTRDDQVMIIEEILNQRIKGMPDENGVWITPAFPKLIYVMDEDNSTEGSKYWATTQLASKCTAKRMVPDYISAKKMREYKGAVYPCMGCRSFLTPDRTTENVANANNYVPGHKYYGRFNQGVVTLNLVDVACSSDGDENRFWEILNERLELCHKALRCRHERLLGTTSDVAPILFQYGAIARLKKHEKIDKLLFGGYSTISLGYAGLYECTYYMTHASHTGEGKEFALSVMQALNDACAKWKEAENIDYSVYGTPLESTTYKFAKALRRRFGVIPGVTDKDYITNSYHVHVTEKIDAFKKLAFESEFQKLSPGGAISYVEVPDLQGNLPAVQSIMQFIGDKIMYAELNTKSDLCEKCGFDGEIQVHDDGQGKLIWQCPNCGCTDQAFLHVARRTCGYIGTQFWNQGRTQEIKERVLHVSQSAMQAIG